MRVLIYGGRSFSDWPLFVRGAQHLSRLHGPLTSIIQGEAPGADAFAKRLAILWGLPHLDFGAEWENVTRPGAIVRRRADGRLYDAAAGSLRNQRMIDEGRPDHGLAYPGGPGTADMTRRLRAACVPVTEVLP